ncbi:MAG: type II toxin-antitoxin system RelE/ParE family toxin [Spirochaetaceae bacterium]|nr:type II toxin-antitoxin system RelE/ParE family toxin [Spirochaetaceae bacterium]MCF7947189.1 type II toxin-antitoxin system RelE/ParE family toxin [Spirochaetia bacterium]MCF7950054.1 type II toxin-antitoxin system RelE/ParE family toxin [Spirochaetaceae bacterium]
MNYRIFETDYFIKKKNKFNKKQKDIIEHRLHLKVYPQLSEQPYFGNNIKKLKNYHPETWRYRMGNFRLFYEISEKEKIIFITTISTRQRAY